MWPYIFLAPFLILFAVFFVYPIISSVLLSFQQQDGIGPGTWVGLRNYNNLLFHDPRFLIAARNTFLLAGAWIVIMLPSALLLAFALNSRRLIGRAGYRLVFFLPAAASSVVAATVFLLIFDEQFGPINSLLTQMGLRPVGWLTTAQLILPSIFLVTLWKWTGYNSLFFLAGLQSVPADLVEAARLDGANGAQLLLHVYLPLLRPITLVVVVLTIIGATQLFAEPWLLTRETGGPGQGGLTLAQLIYSDAFQNASFGYGAAVACATVVLAVGASLIAYFLLRTEN